MNNTKQGFTAGQSTRVAVNKATHTTLEATKTVTTTVGGFIKGFFASPDAPVAVRATKRISKAT